MAQMSMKSLIESGVHYGHLARKWNPKMKPYIFGVRNQVHIINLQQTIDYARKAGEYAYSLGKTGKKILMVGTKAQAQEIVQQEATRVGAFFSTERWLGGTLTNFDAIRSISENYKKAKELLESEEGSKLIKKERLKLEKKNTRMHKIIQGILDMDELPDAVYVVDVIREEISVKEAIKLGIPTIGLVDTNTDPESISYPIPGNDDALKAIALFTQYIAESYHEGRQVFLEEEVVRAKQRDAQKEQKAKEAAAASAEKQADKNKAKGNAVNPTKPKTLKS
jgi:small subunit ribosomal protein S2